MQPHILITGGTGLIGSRLTELLLRKGYNVAHLTRSKTGNEPVKTYRWQISKNVIEPGAIENAEYIIHLAGANLATRWTESRKEIILKSRTDSSYLLFQKLQLMPHKVKAFIAASGINYYGANKGDILMTEDSPPGDDFLAYVCREWENTVKKIDKLNVRRVQFRMGVVLSNNGGAFPKLMMPVKFGFGAPVGSGSQYMSWIHIDDLCNMYIKSIEDNNMQGVYNASAPEPVTNKEFTRKAAKIAHRPFFMPSVPSSMVKLALGEMAVTVWC